MSLKTKFEREYGSEYTLSKCKENNCALVGITNNYFIINGDAIKETDDEKSVDCIIIDLRLNEENKYKIILCELTSSDKNIKDAKNKFKSSGKLIVNYLNCIDESVYSINCLLLGKIVKNGKSIDKKELLQKFRIEGYNANVIIQNEKCGYNISQLEYS